MLRSCTAHERAQAYNFTAAQPCLIQLISYFIVFCSVLSQWPFLLHINSVTMGQQTKSFYTLHRKKVTFNFSTCPGAPGSLALTDGLDDSVKWSWEQNASPILKMTQDH